MDRLTKQKALYELERFLTYIKATQLTSADGVSSGGLKEEEYNKYPEGTPGIHPYWDTEMQEIENAKAIIEYLKTGNDEPDNKLIVGNFIKYKVAMMEYIESNPQFKSIMFAECGRGLEIILAKAVRDDWEHILCYDIKEFFGPLINGFFQDSRILFFNMQSCHFDPMLLKDYYDKNILLVANHTHPVVLRVFMNWSCFGGIIKEGLPVVKCGKWPHAIFWKEHKPEEGFNKYYQELKIKMRSDE
jgi:hypothetical protein